MRHWLHDPHAITVDAFAISGAFFSVAAWQIQRNLRHNEPGLRLPLALPFALAISALGLFAANRLPFPWGMIAGGMVILLSGRLFYLADHRRYDRDPKRRTVADRWAIVLCFAPIRWIRDKANRHFPFSDDTGSGNTSGMNALLASLVKRYPTLGGVVMANTGDEGFYLDWLAEKYGRRGDIIRLRPRLVGEPGSPSTS
jgi:hypothetical protein